MTENAATTVWLSAARCWATPGSINRSRARILTSGLFGGLVGLAAAVVWDTRLLAASAAGGALARIEKVRDEHWLERNPIDYA